MDNVAQAKKDLEKAFDKYGHRDFVIALIMIEKEVPKKIAKRVYDAYMDKDHITTFLDIQQIFDIEEDL